MMRQNGYITDREYAQAIETPLDVAKGVVQSRDAPYFVDMVNDMLTRPSSRITIFRRIRYRVYTTLDLNLQRAAAEAVRIGMEQVDERLKKQRRFKGQTVPGGAGGAGGARSAYRRDQGAGRRPELRHQPVEPRARQAAAGIDFQAVRLRRGDGYRRSKAAPGS